MRQDQSAISLTVDGRKIPITFSNRSGGKTDSAESKHLPGAQLPEKALGGPQTVENLTLQGKYDPEVHQSIVKWLRSRAGRGRAVATEQYVGDDLRRFGEPETWQGKLKAVDTGEYDASSADARVLEIEISTDAVVA